MVVSRTPEEILEVLTDPKLIARWWPVPFELVELAEGRLVAGGALARSMRRLDRELGPRR